MDFVIGFVWLSYFRIFLDVIIIGWASYMIIWVLNKLSLCNFVTLGTWVFLLAFGLIALRPKLISVRKFVMC